MAMTTPDLAFAGQLPPQDFTKYYATASVAGRPISFMMIPGFPGAAVAAPTPGINGAALKAPVSGCFTFNNPALGNSNLSMLTAGTSGVGGQLLLIDRIWHNSNISPSITTEQIITADLIEPRDRNGTTDGYDVLAALEINTTAWGAVATVATFKYKNTANQEKTGTNAIALTSAPVNAFIPINLASGDYGVQRAVSITLSLATTGNMNIVLYRVIARLPLAGGGIANAIDMITGGFPRIYDDSALHFVYIPATTTAVGSLTGNLVIAQG